MSLPNDAYNHSVTMTTDGTTDTYVVGGSRPYGFPAGTNIGVVYVNLAIQANLILFNATLTDIINNHYGLEDRVRWMALYLETQFLGQPNKQAYVAQLLTWGNAISVYTAQYVAALLAMTDPTAIAATVPNFSSLEAADPKINLLSCMQIVG
jgi:hypothetical protein